MSPDWPDSKQEAYRYTDLSRSSALALPAGEITTTPAPFPDRILTESTGKPVYLEHLLPAGRASATDTLTLAAGIEVTVVETIRSRQPGVSVVRQQMDIRLEQGAHLTHIRHQDADSSAFHWGQTRVTVARDACYRQITLVTGAALSRHEIEVTLAEPGSSFDLAALQLPGPDRHSDITTTIHHNAPHTTSAQLVKAVVAAGGRGVYQGRIRVAPGAIKTDGRQQSRALLLGPGAEMDTKPELEIFADDVSCSHGAASGALDEQALFYLRARGIPDPQARALLVDGFIAEVLDRVAPADLRERLANAARQCLDHPPDRCT